MALSTIVSLVVVALGVVTLLMGGVGRQRDTLIYAGLTVLAGIVYFALWPDNFRASPLMPLIAAALVVVGVILSRRHRAPVED